MSNPVIPPTSPNNGTPGELSGTKPPLKIVVIGAGASGLVAAYELNRAGHDVTILEARDRSGGRIHTLSSPFSEGHFAEAGASRIPSNHQLTIGYAEHFGLEMDSFYPSTGSYFNLDNDSIEQISASQYINEPPWPGSVNRSNYRKIRGGMSRLPQAFSEELVDKIFFQAPVESVVQDTDGVVINTSDGQQHIADRVLCTAPLPVLNKISFTPNLSQEKLNAANSDYNYLASSRVFVQTTSRFWENDGLNGWGNSSLPEEIWQPSWDNTQTSGVLQSYLRGFAAEQFDLLSPAKQIESLVQRLAPAFTDLAEQTISTHVHSWADELWSGGAFAEPSASQEAALGGHVGRAEGRIHFAGEHASSFHAWIQGALESGIRAANEIHNAA
jgi:monoamine oxidase